jgi:phage repressor protein C with HTH and peptisase S24 domain
MESVGKKLQKRIDALGWDQSRLAREVLACTGMKVSRVTINRVVNGESDPRGTTLGLIEATLSQAETGAGTLPPGSDNDPFTKSPTTRSSWLPRLGAVAAGKPTDFELDVLGDKDLPPSLYHAPGEYPATIIATGDSMSPLIKDGDVVVIARRFWREPQTDDIVAVSLAQENGHTIKWLEILPDGRWKLKPRNPDHPEKTVARDQVKAAAVVVGWYHPVHRPRPRKP